MRSGLMTTILCVSLMLTAISCDNNQEDIATEIVSKDYRQIGDSITTMAMKTLLDNVGREMQIGGPVNAVEFCHLNASEIMDSLSSVHRATISRISVKNRNSANQPNESEISILDQFTKGTNDSLVVIDNKTIYYKAIRIGMPACLKCHGSPGADIDEETLAKLNEKYPNDKARGYHIGDLRGAWKVVFN